jgi:poly(3-hydroxybutyrate) depolymerase
MLYQAYQTQRDLTAPARAWAGLALRTFEEFPTAVTDHPLMRRLSAGCELIARSRLTHSRPPFGIDEVEVAGQRVAVHEEVAAATPFGTLLHFAKEGVADQSRVMIVTALAGHFSTLLRNTVETLLPDHDVYVTDWHNARDVPLDHGRFGLDEYIQHLIDFLDVIGPGGHVLAVCQPCPATLSAVSVMAEAGHPAVPKSLTLMAGPVDTRINPTVVNEMARDKPIEWFEQNVITRVPLRYPGAMRRVYPGFLQVTAFVSMNLERHVDQHVELYKSLVHGDLEAARVTEDFYDEYFAVLDMPAEFYLETVDAVFKRDLLPKGELQFKGRKVDPSAIRRTALMTVEGERDDICGIGQTLAAHDLCSKIRPSRKVHHLQAGVGHYGVFSGRRWQQQIYPRVHNFILAND